MRRRPTWLLPLLLLMLLPVALRAQGMQRRGGAPSGVAPGGAGGGDRGFINGQVWFVPEEKDAPQTPGAGTVVIVVTARQDTLYTTVAESGRFRFFNVPVGPARVSFKMIGYGEEGHGMDVTPGENKVVAYLKPASYQLEGAVLKADVPPIAIDKDTIIFRAAAVKVNKGEMAIDILSQMPGVEITETGAKVLNEEVTRVYVDGALLFGEAPMSALNSLPAEEVVDIRSYQEYANKDPDHKISKNETKERVLDVRTKSRPQFVLLGNAIAGGGFDTDSTFHKFRYTAGVDLTANSETLQASLRTNVNNINNASNRRRGNSFGSVGGGGSPDLRNGSVSLSVNKRWMSPTTRNFQLGAVGASYSYTDSYNVSESLSQLLYFPGSTYSSRVEDRASRNDVTNKTHQFSVSGSKSLKDGGISLTANYNLHEGLTHAWSSHYNRQDALPRQGTSTGSEDRSHSQSFNASFNAHKRFRNKIGFALTAQGGSSGSDGDNIKTDTTTSSLSYKVLDIASLGRGHNWSVTPSASWEIDEGRTLSLSGGWSEQFSRTEKLAYDISDPLLSLLDSVNTYTYTTDHDTRSATLGYRSYFERAKAVLSLRLQYRSTLLGKHETVPEEDLYERRFGAWLPAAELSTQSMLNRWSVRYSTAATVPSVEQTRPRIDNSNLYNVSAGNPSLRQSRSHSFNLGYSTVLGASMRQSVRQMEAGASLEELLAAQESGQAPQGGAALGRNDGGREGGFSGGGFSGGGGPGGGGYGRGGRSGRGGESTLSTFSTQAAFSLTRDPIVSRRSYFAEDTYLPAYDYTLPAQATLRSWENAPASYSAQGSARFDIPLQKIRWMLSSNASVSWSSTPSYVSDVLTRTGSLSPSLYLGMRSNFSRNVRINLGCNAAYILSRNDVQDQTSYFTERINLGWELNNLLRHLYLGGNYRKGFTQGLPYAHIDDNIFDVRAGARFGRYDNVELSASVHDLFNRTSGFSTAMMSNYISNSWTHQFGRYVFFSLSYRFNSLRRSSGSGAAGAPGQGRPQR